MSRRAMLVAAAIAGSALMIGVGVAVNRSAAVPPTPWNEPDLSGVWRGVSLGAAAGEDTFNLAQLERLYTPAARAQMKQLSAADDPTLGCVPPAFPRAAMLGQPLQIVQRPGFAFIFTEAYPAARIIPTTGRPHTDEQYRYPTHMGDSTARWEGDTLVVDVVSFNGLGWLASGHDKPGEAGTGVWPTSAALHVVERWRRADADTLEYRATVEDPEMLTAPWGTPVVLFTRQPVDRIEEALCLLEEGPASYLARLAR